MTGSKQEPSNWSKLSSKAAKILNTKVDFWNKSSAHSETDFSESEKQNKQSEHLTIARESLEYLLQDKRVPEHIRGSLQEDYLHVQKMLEKLEHEYIHIAVLGRVSVGKSSLLNALMGINEQHQDHFSVSPLHGETKKSAFANWESYQAGHVYLIDTPGINEVDGQAREQMAFEVVSRADIILFVVDGDLTEIEFQALTSIANGLQPILLVLNKADRYTQNELEQLKSKLLQHTEGLVQPENVLVSRSVVSRKTIIYVDDNGRETETQENIERDTDQIRQRLWEILQKEGKTLAALNAAFHADKLSAQVAHRLVESQQKVSSQIIRIYCISKGLAVAVNPVPIADLVSAAIIDIGMIVHMSRIYGMEISRSESASLVKSIMGQLVLLMSSIWLMNFISTSFKVTSFGFSTLLTASAQGAVAYYGTYVVGKAADLYFKQGKSWGKQGPKTAIKKILDDIDRDSIIEQAKSEIFEKVKN